MTKKNEGNGCVVGCYVVLFGYALLAIAGRFGLVGSDDPSPIDAGSVANQKLAPRQFAHPHDISRFVLNNLVNSDSRPFSEVKLGEIYDEVAREAGPHASILVPQNEVALFHNWYRNSPKSDRFRAHLAKFCRSDWRTKYLLLVHAPPNNLDVEWCSFRTKQSTVRRVERLSFQPPPRVVVSTGPGPSSNREALDAAKNSKARDLAIAGALIAGAIIGEAIKQELSGQSGDVFVNEYYRQDGTRVRAHYRSPPSR